ncbi:MAG TPA: hypothetical protein VM529_24300, partial [Gemmata sp.]|nr:hypothetical protein [Gemmata sp.]
MTARPAAAVSGFQSTPSATSARANATRYPAAAGRANLGAFFYVLLGVGALNTALSAYYYLRVVRAMLLE